MVEEEEAIGDLIITEIIEEIIKMIKIIKKMMMSGVKRTTMINGIKIIIVMINGTINKKMINGVMTLVLKIQKIKMMSGTKRNKIKMEDGEIHLMSMLVKKEREIMMMLGIITKIIGKLMLNRKIMDGDL